MAIEPLDSIRARECEGSLIQQMRYMQYLSAPASSAYNVNFLTALNGQTDIEVLGHSVHALVERHPVLRTTYVLHGGRVFQKIASNAPQVMRIVDTLWTPTEIEQFITQEADRPFDLDRGPVLRVNVLCSDGRPHRLQIVIHHIAMDYRGYEIFCGELSAIYLAFISHRTATLPHLKTSYEQYALEQRAWLESTNSQPSRDFWATTLASTLPVLSLPIDRPYPPSPSFAGNAIVARMSPDRVHALRTIAASFKFVTPSMFVLTCLALWLKTMCRQNNMVIGLATNDRQVARANDVLGDFANTVPIRLDFTGRANINEATTHVRDQVVSALKHRRVPLISMLPHLNIDRSSGASPIFQVLFAWNRVPTSDPTTEKEASPFQWSTGSSTGTTGSTHEISLMVLEQRDRLKLQWVFNRAVFEPSTQQSLADRFQDFIESVLTGTWSDPEAELWTTVCRWNSTDADFPDSTCMHELIEAQVERLPDQLAVVAPGYGALTYQELNARANQLARHLADLGVRPDTLVALCMRRSIDMVIAILGVLKAGGAYLPIDPDIPGARTQYMIEDARPLVVLTQSHLAGHVLGLHTSTILLDTIECQQRLLDYPTTNLEHTGTHCKNLVYVIYTSGSTGEPKGVQVEHRSLVNRIWWMQTKYQLTPADRVLQKTPYAFDVSVWEFVWPLITGAAVVIARPGGHYDPGYLIDVIREFSVSVIHFVPSMLYPMLDEPRWTSCESLRLVFCSGESLPLDLKDRFFTKSTGAELHNLYGPTEAAIDVSYWECTPGYDHLQVPIGRPISNTKLYILDSRNRLVPVGTQGELHIGGVCLARGYLNKPELTAERFITNVLPGGNARLYKTGDLARYRPDGVIEYLGRLDQQVKVRGFRIELGEIESALLRCDGVERALADSIDGQQGQKLLVAWVITSPSAAWSAENTQMALSNLLPAYAVPAIIQAVDKFPLTINGKVDRADLRRHIRYEADAPHRPPQTDTERTLVRIWQTVLGFDRVGIDDNYFELGGDSILSLRISAAAREAGIHFELSQLIELRTIRKLALVCKTSIPPGLTTDTSAAWTEHEYPLSALQAGMVYHSLLSSGSGIYHDVFCYRINGTFNVRSMESALASLVQEHELLRTSFVLDAEPEPLQRVSHSARCQLHTRDLTGLAPKDREEVLESWVNVERMQGFDWGAAPLLRLFAHILSPTQFELGFSFSHAILDGWSVAVFVTEILKRADNINCGGQLAVPRRLTPFRRFIQLEREAIESKESMHFWRQTLKDAPISRCIEHLPEDASRGEHNTLLLNVDQPTREGLYQLARSLGESFKSVLLAAHLKTLSLFFGTSDVVTGLVLNGRPEADDAESLLGLFLNTVPFRIDVGASSPGTLTTLVAAHERAIIPHRRVPLKIIQEREKASTLFDVIFNFVHFYKYEEIEHHASWVILGQRVFEETNFPLVVNFQREQNSAGLRVQLSYLTRWFSHEQIANLGQLYMRVLRAFSDDSTISFPPELQARVAVDRRRDTSLDFWAKHLLGIPETHELPLDNMRQLQKQPELASVSSTVGSALLRACVAIAAKHHTDLEALCLAAFAVLIGRFSRSDEVMVGIPGFASPQTSTDELPQPIARWLLRVDVGAQRPFSDVLRSTIAARESSPNGNVYLPQLANRLGHSQMANHPPVCQLYFHMHGQGPGSVQHTIDLLRFPRFDLFLQLHTPSSGSAAHATCMFYYDANIFDIKTVEAMAASYIALLHSISAEPDARVIDLRWTTASYDRSLTRSLEGEVDAPIDLVHERIQFHAKATPHRVAVVMEEFSISYGELDSRANRLANLLRVLGIARESKVGICLPRGCDLVVALLAVLKAGGAYVPLDPGNPAARLRFIVDDAALSVIVTTGPASKQFTGSGTTCVSLDDKDVRRRLCEASPQPPEGRVNGSDLCYVIYTSGSTGSPKGVMIEHHSVARLFTTSQPLFQFDPEDVWTLFHSYAFDFSVWELFGALTSGRKLVVVPESVARTPRDFSDLLVSQRVTILNQTPSAFFNLMASLGGVWRQSSLRYVIFGGEALDPRKLRPVLGATGFDHTIFINMYGITETTVHVTFKRLSEEDVISSVSNIGASLSDLVVHVTDEQLVPVPQGAKGELCISGPGLARGYLNRPELTQQRFVENERLPGKRIYRSGDLARIGSNGQLQYLGRVDRQVKIRGYRIELGEIESQIIEIGDGQVRNAVVIAVDDPGGPSRLVAYVVLSDEHRSRTWQRKLRERLLSVLPVYMVPAFLIAVDFIPLTPNGKIDVLALPKPHHMLDASEHVQARTELEAALVGIYEAVLQVSPIGIADDYFAIGGDSIRVIQLVMRIEALGFSIEGIDILRNPTIMQLAQLLSRGERPAKRVRQAPLQLVKREQCIDESSVEDSYLVSELQQLMLSKHRFVGGGVYHPVHVFRIKHTRLDVDAFRSAVTLYLRDHAVMRSNFEIRGDGTHVQRVHDAAHPNVTLHDVSSLSPAEQDEVVQERLVQELGTPFDLSMPPPLMHFHLFDRGSGHWNLLISSHHAVEDGWGFVEMINGVMRLYMTNAANIPYAYAGRRSDVFKERIALEHEAACLPQAISTWENILEEASSYALPLPSAIGAPTGEWIHFLSPQETSRLHTLAARAKCPLKSVFLLAYMEALSQLFGRALVMVDVIANGRSNRLSDPTTAMGLFWNFLPIPFRITTATPWQDLRALNALLLRAEEFSTFPVMRLARQKGFPEGLTPAAFNYVQFHNVAPDLHQDFELVRVLDRFHHAIKLAVTISPDGSRAQLQLDFNPTWLTPKKLALTTDSLQRALDMLMSLQEPA